MTPDDRTDASRQLLDLAGYSRAVRKRWPVVLLAAVLGMIAGWAAAGERTPSYESSALLTVNSGLLSYTSTGTEVKPNMATEQQIAKSTGVIALAAETLGDITVTQFQQQARAAAASDANTIVLTFTGGTPERAQQGANDWASAYLADRARRSEDGVAKARTQIEARLASQGAALVAAQQELDAAVPDSTAERLADAKVSILEQQQANLQTQLDALSLLVADPGEVISSPVLPRTPEGLPDSTFILAGLLIGALVGVTLAVMIERRRGTVQSAAEVRERAGAPAVLLADHYPPDPLNDPGIAALASRVSSAAAGSSYVLVVTDADGQTAEPIVEPLAAALRIDGAAVAVGAGRRAAGDHNTIRLVVAPAAHGAAARSTMARADGVLLVVRASRTRMRAFSAAVDAINEADALILAVAVVDVPVDGTYQPDDDASPVPARPSVPSGSGGDSHAPSTELVGLSEPSSTRPSRPTPESQSEVTSQARSAERRAFRRGTTQTTAPEPTFDDLEGPQSPTNPTGRRHALDRRNGEAR